MCSPSDMVSYGTTKEWKQWRMDEVMLRQFSASVHNYQLHWEDFSTTLPPTHTPTKTT